VSSDRYFYAEKQQNLCDFSGTICVVKIYEHDIIRSQFFGEKFIYTNIIFILGQLRSPFSKVNLPDFRKVNLPTFRKGKPTGFRKVKSTGLENYSV